MTNPLLTPFSLPPFSKIQPEHVVPAVTKALNDCRENVERVVAQGAPYTWENLCQPLAEVDDVLGRIFSPVSHLNSVKNSPELREAYEQTLPLLSECLMLNHIFYECQSINKQCDVLKVSLIFLFN